MRVKKQEHRIRKIKTRSCYGESIEDRYIQEHKCGNVAQAMACLLDYFSADFFPRQWCFVIGEARAQGQQGKSVILGNMDMGSTVYPSYLMFVSFVCALPKRH